MSVDSIPDRTPTIPAPVDDPKLHFIEFAKKVHFFFFFSFLLSNQSLIHEFFLKNSISLFLSVANMLKKLHYHDLQLFDFIFNFSIFHFLN